MGILDKFKNAFSMPEEDYYGDVDMEEEEEDYTPPRPQPSRRTRPAPVQADNVVEMPAPAQHTDPRSAGVSAPVVFEKINAFGEVNAAADSLLKQKIVILNLETCADDDSRRIIDVLTGVAYANGGKVHRIAGRAYIVTPNARVTLSGEMLDEVMSSARNGSLY